MFVYIILLCVVLLMGWLYEKNAKTSKLSWLYLVGIILSVSFVSGMRDIGVGTDTRVYSIDYFQNGIHLTKEYFFANPDNLDRGYLLLNYIASLLGNEYWLGMFLTHFFIWSILLIAAVKLKKINKYSITLFLFIYFAIFYNRSLNYMRQSCSMSIVLLAYYYYVIKEWKKVVVLMAIAIMFHTSAIVSLLIPLLNFIVHIKRKDLKAIIIITTLPLLILITKLFDGLLQIGFNYGLFKDVYLDRYESGSTTYRTGGFGKETILLFGLELLIIIDSWKRKNIDNIKFQFSLLLHIAYISMYSLTKISEYLYRNSYYFYLIDLFYIAYLLSKSKKERNGALYVLFCISLMICWYTYFIIGNACQTYPYTSSMLNIK